LHPVGDLVQGLVEFPDAESLLETSTVFVPLPVAFTPGILVISGLVCGCIGGQLVF
jgi:hypothetical protein